MHFSSVALMVAACFISQAFALPLVADPGSAADVIVTSKNTVNGTSGPVPQNASTPTFANSTSPAKTDSSSDTIPDGPLYLQVTNNLPSNNVVAYITGQDFYTKQPLMLQTDGTFTYPTTSSGVPQTVTGNIAIPLGAQGNTIKITIPSFISSARVWFSDGTLDFFVVATPDGVSLVEPSQVNPKDPSAAVNWGFVELSWVDIGIFANISYVDFVGLPLGMTLTSADGSVQSAPGLKSTAVKDICDALSAQAAKDGAPWDQLCITENGAPIRALNPTDYVSSDGTAFSDYWTDYVDKVWDYYSSNTLTIDTQESYGKVDCKVSGGTLTCDGDNRGYAKPVGVDIFGCNSGPFARLSSDNDIHVAVIPRLCAAFNRSTLLLSGGNVQPSLPSSSYYTVSPTNWFSYIVHENEVNGAGYAFSYDDVNPAGENQSGTMTNLHPTLLSIVVGGPK